MILFTVANVDQPNFRISLKYQKKKKQEMRTSILSLLQWTFISNVFWLLLLKNKIKEELILTNIDCLSRKWNHPRAIDMHKSVLFYVKKNSHFYFGFECKCNIWAANVNIKLVINIG